MRRRIDKIALIIILTILFVLLTTRCEDESLHYPKTCKTGECNVKINIENGSLDTNGYIHYTLTNGEYVYFNTYVEATETHDRYKYNNVAVIEASFDTDTYWILSDSLAVRIPLYVGFGGLRSSPYWSSTKLPVGNKLVYLSQYAGFLVPIVQSSRIYLQKYEENPYGYTSEYKPQEHFYWGKRIVGPIPKAMKGDTVQLFTKIFWEAGSHSKEKNDIITKIIFE
jgi:hypothetical protein